MFNYRKFSLFFTILLNFALSSCQTLETVELPENFPVISPQSTPLSDPATLFATEREIYQKINQYRLSQGLDPLQLNPTVTQQARLHSERMAAKTIELGHRDLRKRIETINILVNVDKVGENIALISANNNLSDIALQRWLNDPIHRQPITGDFNLTGIGVAQAASGEYYLTQIFVKENPSPLTQSPNIGQSELPWEQDDPLLSSKSQDSTYLITLEQEIHRKVNEYRLSRQLPPLQMDARISEVARVHSQKMANGSATFSHDGFDNRAKSIEITIKYRSVAENLAYLKGYPDLVSTAVEGWINSPGHRKNMEGNFNLTGVGIAKNAEGEYYFTQLFVLTR